VPAVATLTGAAQPQGSTRGCSCRQTILLRNRIIALGCTVVIQFRMSCTESAGPEIDFGIAIGWPFTALQRVASKLQT